MYNFRQADIDAGGNGAPLMPFLDWLLFKDSGRDTITLNLGGVANISFIPKSGKRSEVLGFDTGPGMALVDECCQHFYGEPFDKGGEHAEQGRVNEEILLELMKIDFIKKKVGLKILSRLTDTESIKSTLLQYQKSLKAEFGDIIQKESASIKPIDYSDKETSKDDLKKLIEEFKVPEFNRDFIF